MPRYTRPGTGLLNAFILLPIYCAQAASSVQFQACDRTTCAVPTSEQEAALKITSEVVIQADTVVALTGVQGCANCTKVIVENGRELIVLGAPRDIACQLFGGSFCQQKK